MIKFPYGLADFYRIRTEGYLYLDRTSHIGILEELGNALLFLRPRRFGKSLWLQTLRNYYDLRLAGEFERLFGELDVGRRPTALRNRYFVLSWDFSEVSALGDAARIGENLDRYVNDQIVDFLTRYEGHLPRPVPISETASNTLRHLLTALSETPYRLYLLIDEYDNFINEVMVRDATTYRGLVEADGPFKELFKSLKSAMQGQGLDRIFLTGVSPVALSDVSSGFNVARDVYLESELATLCGFTETEIRGLLERLIEDRDLPIEAEEEALTTMSTWYNGYLFSELADTLVYNPINTFHFLQHLDRRGTAPVELQDRNLATDQGKLAFLARAPAGARMISELTEGDGTIEVFGLETRISVADLSERLDTDRDFLASFLYYLGLLTLTDQARKLRVPNLVVRKLYLDRLLEIRLPRHEDRSSAREQVLAFFRDGDPAPLLRFVEEKLFPVLSNRDYKGMQELVFKSLLLSLLFDDRRYALFSELEVAHGYADLCLLRRPSSEAGDFDLLFELKYVGPGAAGLTGLELREIDEAELRELPPVEAAFAAAREQAGRYARSLRERLGDGLALRSYAVVAVGLERLLGEVIS